MIQLLICYVLALTVKGFSLPFLCFVNIFFIRLVWHQFQLNEFQFDSFGINIIRLVDFNNAQNHTKLLSSVHSLALKQLMPRKCRAKLLRCTKSETAWQNSQCSNLSCPLGRAAQSLPNLWDCSKFHSLYHCCNRKLSTKTESLFINSTKVVMSEVLVQQLTAHKHPWWSLLVCEELSFMTTKKRTRATSMQ